MTYANIVKPSAQGSGTSGLYNKWFEPNFQIRYQLQFLLQDRGGYSGPIDGAVGANTVIGVAKYAHKASGWNDWYDRTSYNYVISFNPDQVWGDFRTGLS